MVYTQDSFDEIVTGLAIREVDYASRVVALKMQGDPDVLRKEEELMMLQNIYQSLKNYDLDYDIIENDEIEDLFELATIIVDHIETL